MAGLLLQRAELSSTEFSAQWNTVPLSAWLWCTAGRGWRSLPCTLCHCCSSSSTNAASRPENILWWYQRHLALISDWKWITFWCELMNKMNHSSYMATGFFTPAMMPSSTALPSSSRKESFTPLASSRAAIFFAPFSPDTCAIQAEEPIRSSQNIGRKTGKHLAVGYSTKNAWNPLGNSSTAT